MDNTNNSLSSCLLSSPSDGHGLKKRKKKKQKLMITTSTTFSTTTAIRKFLPSNSNSNGNRSLLPQQKRRGKNANYADPQTRSFKKKDIPLPPIASDVIRDLVSIRNCCSKCRKNKSNCLLTYFNGSFDKSAEFVIKLREVKLLLLLVCSISY